MLLNILLAVHILVSVLLGVTVLLQRSEGGALGMGGGPSGFMTARGTGDLLTRSTWILFALFLILSIFLTILAGRERAGSSVTGRGQIEKLDPNALAPPPAATPDTAPPPSTVPAPQLRGLPAPSGSGSAVDGALGGVAPSQTPPAK
ncbi:MAG: preprotein translocase subunit SecG [Caulobacter sp.]|nr:preprotein translocase subunit SecG [Caulobacter sp.]